MGRRKSSAHAWKSRFVPCAAFLVVLQGCGVTTSGNCTDKADCVEDGSGPRIDASGPTIDATVDHTSPGDGVAPSDDAAGEMATDTMDANLLDAVDEGASTTSPMDAARDGSASGDGALEAAVEVDAADANTTSDAAVEGAAGCDPLHPDCTNAACAPEFACAPSVPDGWSGPSVLFDMSSAAPPAPQASACPTSGAQYATDAFDGHANPAPQGTCACACGAVTGTTCTGPTITIYHGGTCASQCQNVPDVTTACDRGCTASDALSAAVTAAPVPSGGACAASASSTIAPFATGTDWTTTGRVCGASRTLDQGGCATNQVCADAPPTAAIQAWCVYQSGTAACPAGYPTQHVYFTGATDTRTCDTGSCACGAASGTTCNIDSVSVSATTDCASPATFVSTAIGACNENLAATARNVTASVTPSGGQCGASGTPSLTGAVTPTTPTTVCCTQ
jgi:hypothetical protein